MTLLQGEHIIPPHMRDNAGIDLEQYAKSRLMHRALDCLGERDDLFETEDGFMGTTYKFRAHVFSEAELAEYKNRVIAESFRSSGEFFAMIPTPTTQEDNLSHG